MAATNNPLDNAHPSQPDVSQQTHTIAGILTTVHGLSEIPPSATSIACLWLLHPRLQAKDKMSPVASAIVHAWNQRTASFPSKPSKGLIAVSFDQRNHGSRTVDKLHNQAWREGNPRHAQDMFGCFHGTAVDTSHLISYLESYILTSPESPRIMQHLVLGISLGGHAAWHCILSDPRITAAVVGIGCPDYTRLMTDRARLSKLESYASTTPPGAAFLGSSDFPAALQNVISQFDPAGLLLPNSFNPSGPDPPITKAALDRMGKLIRERLQGKKILNLSGKVDKLVPYAAGEPFLKAFKQVLREDASLDVEFEDVTFEGVGHAFPKEMVERSAEWICGILEEGTRGEDARVESKM